MGVSRNVCLGVDGDSYLVWSMRVKLVNEARVYGEVYVDGRASICYIQNLYLCWGGQYREPPGLLSRIESPRHAFPKTNR